MTNTKLGEIQMLFEKAEEFGWTVGHEYDNVYWFSKYSEAGQDFNIQIDTEGSPELFLNNLYEYYSDFDVSSEAYLWLNESGHGKNGAPYDMKDVYEDMEQCQSMILELHSDLQEYYYNEIYKESYDENEE